MHDPACNYVNSMGKEVDAMIARLWAQEIMLGKKTYDQVPRLLKDQVKEILIKSGREDLAGESTESNE